MKKAALDGDSSKHLLEKEENLRKKGFCFVAGVDEAGRGPLAGPVVAAAVILREKAVIPRLRDSKQVPEKERVELYRIVRRSALAVGVGSASPREIDRLNIYEATRLAMERAVKKLKIAPDFLLLDAMRLPGLLSLPQESVVRGDQTCACIAAASIMAKVTRDRWMMFLHRRYPAYGFHRHKGYPTAAHLEALRRFGTTPQHRRSFRPVKEFLSPEETENRS